METITRKARSRGREGQDRQIGLFDAPLPACATCDGKGAYYPTGSEFASRCSCGAVFERRKFRFATRVAKAKPERAEPKRKKRPEPTCADCGMTWAEGCARPDWMWVDEGSIGINECARCGRDTCHHCYAREEGGWGTLCAACFALPKPPTDRELRDHRDVKRAAPQDVARTMKTVRARVSWPFAKPTGQYVEISPMSVWYWRTYAVAGTARDSITEKERERRFNIVANRAKKPTAADRAWLPEGFYEFLTVGAKASESD